MRDALPHLFEASPDLMYQLVTMLSPEQLKVREMRDGRVRFSAAPKSRPLAVSFALPKPHRN